MSTLHYRRYGSGIPVVLIHGFLETHELWNSFAPRLAAGCDVITIDLPGFGLSPLPDAGFTLDDVADRVVAFLDTIQVETCIMIGHSLGGYVTLAVAARYPHRLLAFGLFHSTALADSDEKKVSRNKVIEFVKTHGVEAFVRPFIPPLFFDQQHPAIPQQVAVGLRTSQETLTGYAAAMRDRPDRTHVLRSFEGPILLLAGEKDTGVPLETLERQAVMAKRPILHRFPHVAHMGMFEDEPATLQAVASFVQACTSQVS